MANELENVIQELRLLQGRANQIQERIQEATKDVIQFELTLRALEQLENVKVGEENLVQIGEGVWVKGTIADNSNVLSEIGAGVVTEKTVAEAIESIKEKKEQLKIIKNRFENDLKEVAEKGQFLQGKARKLQEQNEPLV